MAKAKKAKQQDKKTRQLQFLIEQQLQNTKAIEEYDPKKKRKYTIHDLKIIKPKNFSQKSFFESFLRGNNTIGAGSAGTGKTYISIYLALNEVLSKQSPQNKLIIVRSIVPTREIGFLPGTETEKMEPYMAPYKDIISDLLQSPFAFDRLVANGQLEFVSTSHIRGLTWEDSVVVMDECQNMTFHEINSVVTRLGSSSRLIAVGDTVQTDIRNNKETSGFDDMFRVAERMDTFDTVVFTRHDIVRGPLVRQWIGAVEEIGLL